MDKETFVVGMSFDSQDVALLVQKASQFKSHISIVIDEKTANAKSIMGLFSIELQGGMTVTIVAAGEDSLEAIATLRHVLSR